MRKFYILFIINLFLFACAEAPKKDDDQEKNATQESADVCQEIQKAWESIEGYDYVWGGESFKEGGFDCSGAIYHVQKVIGNPVPRTTSKKYNILAGGQSKHWSDGQCGDWIWWSFSSDRPYGHIGMHIDGKDVWQSGSSTGPKDIIIQNGNYWDRNFEESKSLD